MSETTPTQRTIEWIKVQRADLELKIARLTNELEQTRKDYDGFTALLSKLQADKNYSFWDAQTDCLDSNPSDNSVIETNDSSNYSDQWIQTRLENKQIRHQSTSTLQQHEDDNSDETSSEDISENLDEEDEIYGCEELEEHNSSPKDWLHSKYQSRLMEDVILEILKLCQPATPSDVTRMIYNIAEDDPNFERARNSANAALTYGKRIGKWKTLRRGVYVLNSFQKSLEASFNHNGYQ